MLKVGLLLLALSAVSMGETSDKFLAESTPRLGFDGGSFIRGFIEATTGGEFTTICSDVIAVLKFDLDLMADAFATAISNLSLGLLFDA
jgi:hypothetical protein